MTWLLLLVPLFAASIALEHRKLRRRIHHISWTIMQPVIQEHEWYFVSAQFQVLLKDLVEPSNIAPRPYFVKSPTP